jgi:peptide chain release factor 3
MQVFYDAHATRREPILGVIGRLQFEVAQARLQSEYGVETTLDTLPYEHVRWLEPRLNERDRLPSIHGSRRVEDEQGNPAILFENDWSLGFTQREHPQLRLFEAPPDELALTASE